MPESTICESSSEPKATILSVWRQQKTASSGSSLTITALRAHWLAATSIEKAHFALSNCSIGCSIAWSICSNSFSEEMENRPGCEMLGAKKTSDPEGSQSTPPELRFASTNQCHLTHHLQYSLQHRSALDYAGSMVPGLGDNLFSWQKLTSSKDSSSDSGVSAWVSLGHEA